MAVTMQAVSGAGYPGVPSLDILGNVIPYITNEEEKMEEETQKLLGVLHGTHITPAPFAMSAQCNRVAVEDGHTESVAIRLKKKAAAEEIIAAWNDFRAEPQQLRLPSAPDQPIVYMTAPDRPQPRFDCDLGARHDHRGRPLAQVQRPRLEVHRPIAQHNSRRGRGCLAQCRTSQGEGVSGVRSTFTTETRSHGEKPQRRIMTETSTIPWMQVHQAFRRVVPGTRQCQDMIPLFSVSPCLRGEFSASQGASPPMIVMKFGGTSVQDAKAIDRVAHIVQGRLADRPVVVVSAMAKVTDSLLAMGKAAGSGDRKTALKMARALRERHYDTAGELLGTALFTEFHGDLGADFEDLDELLRGIGAVGEITPRTYDNVASFGEMLSSKIVAAAFVARGLPGVHVDSRQVLLTDNSLHARGSAVRRNQRAPAQESPAAARVRQGSGDGRIHWLPIVPASPPPSAAEARISPPLFSARASMPSASKSGPTLTA